MSTSPVALQAHGEPVAIGEQRRDLASRAIATVGVRDLKTHASEILRRVREQHETIEVTYRGRPVARLSPVEQPAPERTADTHAAFWARWDRLAAEIGAQWPGNVSGAEAVERDRREL